MKKHLAHALAASALLSFAMAPAAFAQDSQGWGGFDSGDTLTINVFTGAGGDALAGAVAQFPEGGSGEANVDTTGVSNSGFDLNYSNCPEAGCPENSLSAYSNSDQTASGNAWSMSHLSGTPAMAQTQTLTTNMGVIAVGVGACPTGCPTPEGE